MIPYQEIQTITERYLAMFPGERQRLEKLLERTPFFESILSRQDFIGHITVSVLVFLKDRKKVLLIHHRQLQKWLKPGGHLEQEDDTLLDACRREVLEETGIENMEFLDFPKESIPIDIDIHIIPANPKKNEPEHWHYDFCFAGIAHDESVTIQEQEVTEYQWLPIDEIKEPRLKNIFQKMLLN